MTVPAFVRAALVAAVVSIALVRPAAAQVTPDGGRLDLAIGAGWVGGVDLGSAGATEATGAGQRVPIFTTSTTLGSLSLVEGRVGWRLTHALSAQADASFGRPLLRIAVDNDVEGAPSTTISERVEQFTIGGSVVWHVPMQSPRVAPFALAGGGYLRQLHENATLVQGGRYYQVGGGVDVLLTSRQNARLDGVGVRVDARALVRVNGVAFDDSARTAPAVGASLFFRF